MTKFELTLRRRNIPDAELLSDLRRVAEKLGSSTVTAKTYDEHGQFGPTTIVRRFESWNNALTLAGMNLTNRINIPDEELFENLAAIWERLGRQPFRWELSKTLGFSRFSLGTYEKRFGSWNNALTAFIAYIERSDGVPTLASVRPASNQRNRITRTGAKINWRLRATVLIRDSCICRMCGASPAKDSAVVLHADHMEPWSKGGETVLDNLQTLCAMCNIGKSDLASAADPSHP